jgi:hypothetical protein
MITRKNFNLSRTFEHHINNSVNIFWLLAFFSNFSKNGIPADS